MERGEREGISLGSARLDSERKGEETLNSQGQYGHFHCYVPPVRTVSPLSCDGRWMEGYVGKKRLAAGYTGATDLFRGM